MPTEDKAGIDVEVVADAEAETGAEAEAEEDATALRGFRGTVAGGVMSSKLLDDAEAVTLRLSRSRRVMRELVACEGVL